MERFDSKRNYGCRLQSDATLYGLRTLVMQNEKLRVTILVDKGADIYEFLHKPTDTDFMWQTPMGLHNPSTHTPTNTTAAGPFMDHYAGGWQEIFPSGGAENIHAEVSYGQHGEVCQLPWEVTVLEDHPDRVSVQFTVRTLRTPYLLERRMTLNSGEAKLHISEILTNLSSEPMDFMWGHHVALGEPFMDEWCRLDCAARSIKIHENPYSKNQRFETAAEFTYPTATDLDGREIDFRKVLPKSSRKMDMSYLTDLTEPWYALTHTKRQLGFGLRFDSKIFDTIWCWQVFGGGEGAPWFSQTYNMGLEPFSSWPGSGLDDVVRSGRHKSISGNAVIETHLTAVVYEGLTEVTSINEQGDVEG